MGRHDEDEAREQNVDEWKDQVRGLNDVFRKDRKGGIYRLSKRMVEFGYDQCNEVLQAIAAYDNFTPENDPPGLHEFGCVTVRGTRYFWNIDYLDKIHMEASPDPADASVTLRVLEVMTSFDMDDA